MIRARRERHERGVDFGRRPMCYLAAAGEARSLASSVAVKVGYNNGGAGPLSLGT